MNCFSSGLEVSSLCRSVPSNSVTKYLLSRVVAVSECLSLVCHSKSEGFSYISSSGEIKISLRLMTFKAVSQGPVGQSRFAVEGREGTNIFVL